MFNGNGFLRNVGLALLGLSIVLWVFNDPAGAGTTVRAAIDAAITFIDAVSGGQVA